VVGELHHVINHGEDDGLVFLLFNPNRYMGWAGWCVEMVLGCSKVAAGLLRWTGKSPPFSISVLFSVLLFEFKFKFGFVL
jgi:hypothetical protein